MEIVRRAAVTEAEIAEATAADVAGVPEAADEAVVAEDAAAVVADVTAVAAEAGTNQILHNFE